MRFRVTGGRDGVSGIDVGSKRFEVGDVVDLTAKQAEWLIEQGYLEPADSTKKAPAVEAIEIESAEEPVAGDEGGES